MMLCLLCMFNSILKRLVSAVSCSGGVSYFLFAQWRSGYQKAEYLVFPLARKECAGLRISLFFFKGKILYNFIVDIQ